MILTPSEAPASVLPELRAWSERFEFEEAAVLVNIPQVPFDLLDRDVARTCGYFAYPPSSLLYLGACFRVLGVQHEIVDLNYTVLRAVQEGREDLNELWKSELREAIGRYRRPLVCVSFMFEATHRAFEAICRFIKDEFPDVCVAAGGVNATADPDLLLGKDLVDVVFCNEGEQTLAAFYAFLRRTTDAGPVNLVFKDDRGQVKRTPVVSGGPVDVDVRPEYDLIPTRDYHKAGSLSNFSRMVGLDVPFGTVLAKRGCRAFCAFCGVRNFNGKGVRRRNYEDVVDEMVLLRSKFGVEHFDWLDDDLLYDKKDTINLFREMTRRVPGITWAANNGLIAGAIDRDVYDAMAQSGCVGFKVGLESGNPAMLKTIHKPASVAQFLLFATLAQEYPNIFVSVNFILGLPDERFHQMLDSLRVAVQSRLHWQNFYIYQHLKNTEFYITYGGMGDEFNSREHGKDSQGPLFDKDFKKGMGADSLSQSINPVRSGAFNDFTLGEETPTGYEVFDIDPGTVVSRPWIREVWFTFNTVANFLLNPCLNGSSESALNGMIRWLTVLGTAYPHDALMACLRYFLMRRAGSHSAFELDTAKDSARRLIVESTYWQARDRQFRYSSFLDFEVPALPPSVDRLLKSPVS